MIKIKDFSNETGFSLRMLRYLEEVGLLIPARDQSNYRVYNKEQVQDVLWIKKLQNLGIQLKEIETLKSSDSKLHLKVLKNVLLREQEIAEIKSETIPVLKSMIDFLTSKETTIQEYYKSEIPQPKKMRTLGGEEKIQRTAYNIAVLRNIYEDHLTIDAEIELLTTDFIKFNGWISECDYDPMVFSVLKESSYVFGKNINQYFIDRYEEAWKKFLPVMGFMKLDDFSKNDIEQLMGPHDIVIVTRFKYKDSNIEGEIVIPYSPVYTMSQLSMKVY